MINIVLTAAITLIGGIILFIVQYIIIEILIRPIQKQKKVIEDVAIYLIHYSNLYTNPTQYNNTPSDSPIGKKYMDAVNKIRELAALLKVRSDKILIYNFWVKLNYVINRKNIDEAFACLICLSNSFGHENDDVPNNEIAKKIRISLKIPEFK